MKETKVEVKQNLHSEVNLKTLSKFEAEINPNNAFLKHRFGVCFSSKYTYLKPDQNNIIFL